MLGCKMDTIDKWTDSRHTIISRMDKKICTIDTGELNRNKKCLLESEGLPKLQNTLKKDSSCSKKKFFNKSI